MTLSNGYRKWTASHWDSMLRSLLPILHDLRPGCDWWTFGGGTSLTICLGHRVSYDIDIFVESAKLVRSLTPNANPLVKALQGNLPYDYPGPYLKLHRPDGEIDIITAAACTEPGSIPWEFEGATIMLDTPVETAVKKMFFRPSTFKIRDVFDLAAILDTGHEKELSLQMGFLVDKIQLLQDRLTHLAPMYERLAAQDVRPTEEGRRWLKRTAVEKVCSFLGC